MTMTNTGRFDARVLKLRAPTYLDNYLQVWRYFCNIEDDLLDELRAYLLVCMHGPAVLAEALATVKGVKKDAKGAVVTRVPRI